jgi:glycosyltransferase involved in cell wall biosynthesis
MEQNFMNIIICTYNRAQSLKRALECVTEQDTKGLFNFNVIVIDDGSTDQTKKVVNVISKKAKIEIKYIYKRGGGIADARNKGINEAEAKYIVFCDDDTYADRDWLYQLYIIAIKNNAKCVAGKVLLDIPSKWYRCLGPRARGHLAEYDYGDKDKIEGKHLPPTCNLMISRRIAQQVKGFDASMLQSGEDTDFMLKIWKEKIDIWYAPKAVVYHLTPFYRLDKKYIKWCAERGGSNLCYLDLRNFGCFKIVCLCAGRLIKTFVLVSPEILLSIIHKNKKELLEQKILLWRMAGYAKRCLIEILPQSIYGNRYIESLSFRGIRNSLPQDANNVPEWWHH